MRMRRIIFEDGYVAVPVTDRIVKDGKIDPEALMREAIALAQHPQVQWAYEGMTGEPHPTQCPVPEGRTVLDGCSLPTT